MKQMNQYRTPRERIGDELFGQMTGNIVRRGDSCPYSMVNQVNEVDTRPLAMIYAPEQTFTDIYPDEEAFSKGSLFSDLYFPFEACGGGVR